jgi:type I restriction enzyme S subunit
LAESFAGEWGAEPLPGNARVLRATDIDDEGHVIGSGALRRLPLGKLTSRQLEDGDILLEGSGGGPDKPVGRVAFFDAVEHQGPAVCSNFFKTLRPDRRVAEPRFLWRKLMWFYRQPTLLTFQQQTTGIINLKFEEYLNATIEVPADLAEQRVIAQLLDTLDTAIRETEALIDKLKAVKQGLLHDLLTRGIDANGQLRPPQSEAPQLYKESPLGWIPREWETTLLGTCTSWSSGGTPSRAVASYWKGDVPLLTPKDMKSFELNDTIEHVSAAAANSGSRLMPAETVFIVVRGMILAHSFPVVLAACPMAFNQDVKAISAGEQLHSRFLAYWLVANADGFLRKVTEATHGTKKLDMENLVGFPMGLPSLQEQAAITARLEAASKKYVTEAEYLSQLSEMKTGLMDDLLTGRIRVTPLLESMQQPVAQTGA